MFNNHEDIVKIVEDSLNVAYAYGDWGRYSEHLVAVKRISKEVQQRLEYMQSQIDELQEKIVVAEKSGVKMFIDWTKDGYGDKSCAVLCRKIGDVVEVLDTQYSPY